jgi:hypothetical protein
MTCSRIKEMQGANSESIAKNNSDPIFNIPLTANPMGLEYIICNSGVMVIVQLLAIEKQINNVYAHACIYEKI